MLQVLRELREEATLGLRAAILYTLRKSLDYVCIAYCKILFPFVARTWAGGTLRTTVNGVELCVEKGERGIHEELILFGKRERFSTDFLAKTIQTDDVIVDVGANIGYYALLEGRIAAEGQVFAIEPVGESLRALKNNVDLNQLTNISVHGIALGDHDGMATMFVCDHCNWSSPNNSHPDRVIDKQDVEMQSLDSFIEKVVGKVPSLIRMDVEGYEAAVMRGATKYQNQSGRSRFFIEIHPLLLEPLEIREIVSGLKDNGYKVEAIFREYNPGYRRWFGPAYGLIDRLDIGTGFGYLGNTYDELEKAIALGTTHAFFTK